MPPTDPPNTDPRPTPITYRRDRPIGALATVVTIDLSLRLPPAQADRPLAYRVSTPLRRPSSERITDDPDELDRLATLFDRLKAEATAARGVFAASVTSAGTHTFLFYLPAGAEFAPRVADAFAGQTDYAATIHVDPDPQWALYRSHYPTDWELRTRPRRM